MCLSQSYISRKKEEKKNVHVFAFDSSSSTASREEISKEALFLVESSNYIAVHTHLRPEKSVLLRYVITNFLFPSSNAR